MFLNSGDFIDVYMLLELDQQNYHHLADSALVGTLHVINVFS